MSFKEWVAPNNRTEQAGMFLAGAAVPYTFQRTLMPRGVMDQALATGIVMAMEYAVGVLVQDTVEALAAHASKAFNHDHRWNDKAWRRYSIALDLSAIGLSTVLRSLFRQKKGENVARSWARTIGILIGNGAFSGLSAGAFQELRKSRAEKRKRPNTGLDVFSQKVGCALRTDNLHPSINGARGAPYGLRVFDHAPSGRGQATRVACG